jgi:hypothetical protein
MLVSSGCRSGQLDQAAAEELVDALIGTGMWLPCTGATFLEWARREGLLPAA